MYPRLALYLLSVPKNDLEFLILPSTEITGLLYLTRLIWNFETRSHYEAQASLELVAILLLRPLMKNAWRVPPPCSTL